MALEISESHPLAKISRFEEGNKKISSPLFSIKRFCTDTHQLNNFHGSKVARTQIENKWRCREPISCTSDVLEALTDNFREENFIGPTTFGKVYRGKLKLDPIGAETRDVTVKIWDDNVDVIDDGKVTEEEVKFLSHPSVSYHPNLAKLIGFCSNGYCSEGPVNGVVYELNPLDSLYNHTAKDNFSWIQRIKVALEFAKLLEFLHEGEWPFVVFNIDSTNIMLDQACNPVLIDFGLLSGGMMGGQRFSQEFKHMSLGYSDPYYIMTGVRRIWSDVFSYGLILLGLIAKRVDLKEDLVKFMYKTLDEWAYEAYKPHCSLVHASLTKDKEYDEFDAITLTELVMRCIKEDNPEERPTMSQVVNCLKNLRAFQVLNENAHRDKRMKFGVK